MDFIQETTKRVFSEREEFLVIGLTGRVGSGCSTVCDCLMDSFSGLGLSCPTPGIEGFTDNAERDARILCRYAERHWQSFDVIKVRTIILTYILRYWDVFKQDVDLINSSEEKKIKFDETKLHTNFLDKLKKQIDMVEELEQIKEKEKKLQTDSNNMEPRVLTVHRRVEIRLSALKRIDFKKYQPKNYIDEIIKDNNELIEFMRNLGKKGEQSQANHTDYLKMYVTAFVILPIFGLCLHEALDRNYTNLFQRYGNYIRFYGSIDPKNYNEGKPEDDPFDINNDLTNHIFEIPKRINTFIKILRHPENPNKNEPVRVVIDSLKNEYEGIYLRDRYSAFYLISVTKDDNQRVMRLLEKKENKYTENDIRTIDYNEKPRETQKKFMSFWKSFKTQIESDEDIKKYRHSQITFDEWASFIKEIDSKDIRNNIVMDFGLYDKLKKFIRDNKDALAEEYIKKNKVRNNTKHFIEYCLDVFSDNVRAFSYINGLHQFYLQDAESCIQNADIFLTNNENGEGHLNLKRSIIKYICLMLHPGIVVPTPVERCMQIAYTAKVNSGCLSRQVGAVTTDSQYNILSLGWNDVPCGEVSCNRKNLLDLYRYLDKPAYSDYEKGKGTGAEKEFREYLDNTYDFNKPLLSEILAGLPFSYCFKDEYQGVSGDRNQMNSRAMHGEEKALLTCDQKAVQGGYLFTTSSPCVMCAKNAKQHFIKYIYYIEPYPGIAQSHNCNSGDENNRAEYVLFEGAIGRAYTQLFTPIMPYKDELKLRGIDQMKRAKAGDDVTKTGSDETDGSDAHSDKNACPNGKKSPEGEKSPRKRKYILEH